MLTKNKKNLIIALTLLVLANTVTAQQTLLETEEQWENGDFNKTTVDKPNSLGLLELGYQDGTTGDSLNAFWRFDGTTNDFSGNNIDSTSMNNVSYVNGILNSDAANFDPSQGSYVEYSDTSRLNPDEFTVSTWIYKESSGNNKPIINKETSGDRGYKIIIDNFFGEDRAGFYTYSSSSGETRLLSEQTIPNNEWVHLVGTYNASGQSNLYINGDKVTNFRVEERPLEYDKDDSGLLFGASSTGSGGEYFNGSIEEAKIYSKPLTSDEVKAEYFHESNQVFEGRFNNTYSVSRNGTEWYNLFANNTQPANTNLSAELTSKDSQGTLQNQKIDINGSTDNYNLDLAGEELVLEYIGDTSNIENSWSVFETAVDFANVEIDSPSDGENILGTTVTLEYFVESSRTGTAELQINGTTQDTKTVNEGENSFSSTLDLGTGTHTAQVILNKDNGETFQSKSIQFTTEDSEISFTNLQPKNPDRFKSNNLKINYTVESKQDATINLTLNGETKKTDTISQGSTQSFTYNADLRSDIYDWKVTGEYTENGEDKMESTNLREFTIYREKTIPQDKAWSQGTFTATSTDMLNNLGNLQAGYLDGDTNAQTNIPLNDLSAYWRLNSTGTVTDYSTNSNSGSTNSISLGNGILNQDSTLFNSSEESYIEVSDDPSLNPENYTISAWIYKDFTGIDEVPIIQKSTSSRGYDFLIDDYEGVDTLALYLYSSAQGIQRFRTSSEVPSNQWTHVAAAKNNDTVNLYINGEKQPLTTSSSNPVQDLDDGSLVFGATSTSPGGTYFNGRIDQAMIFDKKLTDTEIDNLALNEDTGSYTSTYGYTFNAGKPVTWDRLRINNTLQTNTGLTAKFLPLGDQNSGNQFDLDGSNSFREFSLLQDTQKALLELEGSITDIENTWKSSAATVQYIEKYFNFQTNSITVNNTDPNEGNTIKATAKVENLETGDTDAPVKIEIQKLENNNYKTFKEVEKTFSTNGNDKENLTITWEAVPGPNRINTTVDPNNTIQETQENNNIQTKTVDVPLYGHIYGNVTETSTLSNNDGQVTFEITDTPDGAIYFVDADSNFDFNNLEPIPNQGDLSTVDEKLNTSGYTDSIENTWSQNGNFRQTENYPFYTDPVPVANSTENSDFTTGIVYDNQDQDGFQTQDTVIFTTQILTSREGTYGGKYNYEAKIPSPLKTSDGPNEKIELYRELE